MNCEIEAQRIRLQELNVAIRKAERRRRAHRFAQSALSAVPAGSHDAGRERSSAERQPWSSLPISTISNASTTPGGTMRRRSGSAPCRRDLPQCGARRAIHWCAGVARSSSGGVRARACSEGPAAVRAIAGRAGLLRRSSLQGEAQQITAPRSVLRPCRSGRAAVRIRRWGCKPGRSCGLSGQACRTKLLVRLHGSPTCPDDPQASLGQTSVDVLEQTGWVECIAAPG
jgi:hypothetical protein